MDDNFQFGEAGEVKKVSELFKYQNTENGAGNIKGFKANPGTGGERTITLKLCYC